MKVFVWQRIEQATRSYHPEGGLVVIANDEARAREVASMIDGCELQADEAPDHVRDVADGHEMAWVFPDVGDCCR